MSNSLSTVSFCLAILASIADFPPDIGLPNASMISNLLDSYEKRTGQSTLGVIFPSFPFEIRRPSGSAVGVIRIMLIAL